MALVRHEHVWIAPYLPSKYLALMADATVYCANQVTLHIASNLVVHERAKHVEVDYHFVRVKAKNGIL